MNEASLKLARTVYDRDRAISSSVRSANNNSIKAISAAVDEAAARVKASKASTEVYKLNLEFCQVTSPIAGRTSRYYLTLGNLVNQDQTLLTTVVSLDPMYAYFDMDESPPCMRARRAISAGRTQSTPLEDGKVRVQMGLQGEDGFPPRRQGQFSSSTIRSTPRPAASRCARRIRRIRFRQQSLPLSAAWAPWSSPHGSVADCSLALWLASSPPPKAGSRLLSPGMFVRIRLPIGQPHDALLVIDRAIGSDQGIKYVYVLDKENKGPDQAA